MADWDEDAHPRDEQGRFSSAGVSAFAGRRSDLAGKAERMAPRQSSPGEFKSAFSQAFEGSPFANHVSHYTEEELGHMKTFLSSDGKAGVAVKDHGDGRIEATALFNRGGEKGGGAALLAHVIEHEGVNYVECYGPKLPVIYGKLGFQQASKDRFNKEYAAKGWDHKRFDRPNYYTMTLRTE